MSRPTRPPLRAAALAAGLLLPAFGCNAPGPRSQDVPELGYLEARGADLLDIFELNVGAGTGLHFAAAVEPIRVSYGHYEASKFGMQGRSVGTWDETRSELFVGLHQLLCWEKTPCWGNGFLFTPEELHRHSHERDQNEYDHLRFYQAWGWTTRYEDWEKPWMDVGVELFLFCFGVEVGVSPHETCDFLLGLFAVDAASHDDHAAVPIGILEVE
ncbi:MAG: hypothetical protein ACF8XB_19445 [Planctomycetota bacterium JB042]